ncbi:type II secretory pathway component [Rheinheimera sp. EpRS3]|uniref:type II secretory pathway component n=1 Tax=Rheinheimera sp. EpRS3 TaxID=1712383 RepID=UPI00074A47DE|nr:type II secretory pathway component [Rheinheimera sp. EpRS3]KUM53954.1 type II secretory pathway component [Rheinheimera sp. EpRS3]
MYLNYQKQRGSALVIAVFVIVVMLALAVGLSRLLISSSETVVYEVQGTRALFAAQSGLDIALTQLFPLNGTAAGCGVVTASRSFNADSLQSCNVSISCTPFTNAAPDSITLFQLSSTAECTAGGFQTRRTVQIEVR